MARDPRNGLVRSEFAYFLARLAELQRAANEAAQALQLSPNEKDTRLLVVETYEVLGKREFALAALGNAPPGVLAQLNLYPDVADLHKDSRFLQLLASNHIH